jgi:hypothetical protein
VHPHHMLQLVLGPPPLAALVRQQHGRCIQRGASHVASAVHIETQAEAGLAPGSQHSARVRPGGLPHPLPCGRWCWGSAWAARCHGT